MTLFDNDDALQALRKAETEADLEKILKTAEAHT